jgi:hypothetical protein
MRLQTEGAPDALHRRDRQPAGLDHAPGTPLRSVLRHALQRLHNYRFNVHILDRARCARSRPVTQSVQAMCDETSAPFADGRFIQSQLCRHLLVLTAFRAGQHNPVAHCYSLRRLAPRRQRLQLNPLQVAQDQVPIVALPSPTSLPASGKLWQNHELQIQDTRTLASHPTGGRIAIVTDAGGGMRWR